MASAVHTVRTIRTNRELRFGLTQGKAEKPQKYYSSFDIVETFPCFCSSLFQREQCILRDIVVKINQKRAYWTEEKKASKENITFTLYCNWFWPALSIIGIHCEKRCRTEIYRLENCVWWSSEVMPWKWVSHSSDINRDLTLYDDK